MEDERARKTGICGVTEIGSTGIEWICIKPVHGDVYRRKSGDAHHNVGDLIFSNNDKSFQHYFVNRWPGRKNAESSDKGADSIVSG